MTQEWTETERKVLKQDPLHDVKEEIQHHSPRLRHVELPQGDSGNTPMEDVVKSHVPAPFVDELKKDHATTQPATDFEQTEAEFMEDDPLHDVKQELEHHSPHLRHVDPPYSPGHHLPASPGGVGDVVKSEVPPPFEEELKNDHNIVKGHQEEEGVDAQSVPIVRDPVFVGLRRGMRPRFRISANVGNRPHGAALNLNPETANICVREEADDEEEGDTSVNPQTEESTATKPFTAPPVAARGTPHFRISAHQGMRPGGPLSRDLKSESESTAAALGGDGDGVGADLSAEMKTKGPGLPMSSAGPRRGGLARTGSGVPGGDPKVGGGGLARQGSGVPGNSLAGQGSGAFGGLARTGSGIPSSKGGNNDLKDFSSFLDSA
ncbi:unnamed protein product [Calypogeia fissa]